MDQKLVEYVEKSIYPLYERNDWAHQLWHIKEVVERSLKLAKDYPVNKEMVYVIASFHDLGCFISRDNHEEISAHLMETDSFLQKYFSKEDIKVMREAIVDHRGSLEYEPRSIYGKIISSADRFITIEGILRSTHSHTLEFFSELSWEEMVQRSYQYIKKKYGRNGYAKSYIPNPDFDQFLKDVVVYLDDYKLFSKKLKEIDKLLRKEYQVTKKKSS
ncbi:MAG: HD domain-containing protein [Bacilli bacterium]|nr:HD domain-containing protein [Bacilli bacterium]